MANPMQTPPAIEF
ncbi:hypothetical protein N7484_000759 (mitochondrion) [Penicillium longicatenatum]|nr:hypothetical protein N7484_000759 [Penicillium longicatenatum]